MTNVTRNIQIQNAGKMRVVWVNIESGYTDRQKTYIPGRRAAIYPVNGTLKSTDYMFGRLIL